MPFGIKAAPAIFTRLMHKVLGGVPHVHRYFDGVLIATDTWEEHLTTLKTLFWKIREVKLTIKPKKSEIGFSKILFLRMSGT